MLNNQEVRGLVQFTIADLAYPVVASRSGIGQSEWVSMRADDRLKASGSKGFKNYREPLISVLNEQLPFIDETDVCELTREAVKIYDFFASQQVQENFWYAKENNREIAIACLRNIQKNEFNLWRFGCMPECGTRGIDDVWWNLQNPDHSRTITLPLNRDNQVLKGLQELGYKSNLTVLFNDWEVPLIRFPDSSFRDLWLRSLPDFREETKVWFTREIGFNTSITNIFLSSLISLGEFEVVYINNKNNREVRESKQIGVEIEFLNKLDDTKNLSDVEKRERATSRVAQYPAEVEVLYERSSLGLEGIPFFLVSEYPTKDVGIKANLLRRIPSIYYVKDSEVKNR